MQVDFVDSATDDRRTEKTLDNTKIRAYIRDTTMKEPRVERVVDELVRVVERLNRLNAILVKSNTTFVLHRQTRTSDFVLSDIVQNVEYRNEKQTQ
jgi:hypothetical protein